MHFQPTLIADVLELIPPRGRSQLTSTAALEDRVPLVLDSPHSGCVYPEDFNCAINLNVLRRLEDTWVDELFSAAPDHGAYLLRALFPRSYIDPNRHQEDIDNDMLVEPWPDGVNPSDKVKWGKSLFFRQVSEQSVYDRQLELEEVKRRLEGYYWPYHQHLHSVLDALWDAHGHVYHLNCHSMPGVSPENTPEGPGVTRADFVLGDRDGSTCDDDFTNFVYHFLVDAGFEVKINDPYKGVELVRRYSDPAKGRHSLQIEINRSLYMTRGGFQKSANFPVLKATLDDLLAALCEYVNQQGKSVV